MHIVMLPMPLQGHVSPFLTVARLLIRQGFQFTIVVTGDLAVKFNSKVSNEEPASSIQYAAIPAEHSPPPRFELKSVLDIVERIRPGFEIVLRNLISSPPGVSFVISDNFLPWGLNVASELNIPAFWFYTANAHCFTTLIHTHILLAEGLVPVQDPDRMVECVPGLPPMRAGDLPQAVATYPSFVVDRANNIQKAAGIIINTVYELEKEPLEVIKTKVPIYAIGPLLLMLGGSDKSEREDTVGLWTEQRECLNWLDTRPASSVLYIAFGSLASVSDNQMKELAEGLESSGHAFLWVIRSDAVDTPLSTSLPDGFTERTKDRGLIISWAPQLEVLSHPAVGGFFTHCGWNSITENLSLGGVPMICWPQLAEQRLNKFLAVNKWKVGLELQEKDGIVRRAEVEKAVTQLMQGEVGRELRKRVLELKDIVSLTVKGGGSSQIHLKALGQDMKNLGLTVRV